MARPILEGFYSSLSTATPLYTKDNPVGEQITKQSDAETCDINNIIYQFSKTGQINHINQQTAQYLDLPSDIDYQTSLNIIQEASNAFENLPALMRKRYDNDPAKFLEALSNPNEREYLTEMGVFNAPTPAEPTAPLVGGSGGAGAGAGPAPKD